MAHIEAEFQDRKRIIFTTRDRSFVNVRETVEDGPIGFTSGELLMIALGNCSLGTLMNHELLQDAPVKSVKAILDSEGERNPSRTTNIKLSIELELDDESVDARQQTLERIADNCPVGNTLRFSPQIDIEVTVKSPAAVAQS